MTANPERIPWVDALRGTAVLAIIPLNARWLLHPVDAYHDPSIQGPPDAIAWVFWAIPELLFDHSTLFTLAVVFGISLSATRAADSDPGWTRRHRARLLLLGALGFAHGALIWPGDILYAYAVTALLLTGAVRDTNPASNALAWIALAAAGHPPGGLAVQPAPDPERLRRGRSGPDRGLRVRHPGLPRLGVRPVRKPLQGLPRSEVGPSGSTRSPTDSCSRTSGTPPPECSPASGGTGEGACSS